MDILIKNNGAGNWNWLSASQFRDNKDKQRLANFRAQAATREERLRRKQSRNETEEVAITEGISYAPGLDALWFITKCYHFRLIGCKTLNTFFSKPSLSERSHISANFYLNDLNFGQNVYKIVFSYTYEFFNRIISFWKTI